MDIFMRNIAFSAKEIDIRIGLAEKLHRPPFPTDPPLNFHVHIFKKKGSGMLTLPTREVGETFLSTYGDTSIMVNGRNIEFQLSAKPVNEGRVRHIRSIPWEDPKVLEMRNRRKAKDSQPIKLQGFAFGHFCRDGCFLVDSDSLGKGDIACDPDLRQIRLIVQQDMFDIQGLNPDVDWSSIFTYLFSRKIASYTPSQIKTVITTDASQTPYIVILDSDTPPFLESQLPRKQLSDPDKPQSHRIPSLHDDRQMPPGCHSLCLTFSSHDEIQIFLERCRRLGLTSVQIREDAIHTKHVSLIQAMADLDRQLLAMKFELAFEVEKSVLNGDLEPFEILSLSNTIDSLCSTPSGLSPAAFCFFVSTLQDFYPGRRRRIHSRGSIPRATGLNLDQQLIDATKSYSVKSTSKITPYLVTPATFECYHLIVTPTSRYLEGPIPDQSNSVLRRFGNHECFLRVSIQDERRSKIRREPGIRISNLLESQFGVLLTDGLHLGGRQYEFLGYSMSGLRDHSVWFVTPFKSDTGRTMNAAKIRKKLGNFSEFVYEPARLAARLSQAFSATDPSITLNPDEILRIEDRISTQGSVFTDGCGTISPELCRAVWTKLKRGKARYYSKFHAIPSCLQFRLGGAKGVVVQDPTLNGKVICLRPSQIKFDGLDNLTFDVQSTSSRPRLMFLNRPLIMLLEHLGVKRDVITDLQSTSIREVQSIQTSLTQATKFFLQHNLGTSYHLPSLFNNISKYLKLKIPDHPDSLHHHLMEEALYCAATHALREIKYRAHILVPGSVTLLGVSDEYDCLAEGEIFATVYDESKATEQFIEGKVLITRSPQVHPGDVQLVTAVRRPELNHLKNVVVFSCRGARSLQSCLGGGDIDGDEYNIITDPNLHPPRTVTPGSYEPLERKRTTRPCTIKDLADFVTNYIESDLLGLISIFHLWIADLNAKEGPECEECIQLAEAASHAVDFPKTGTPAYLSSLPRPSSQVRPDFLAPESVDSVDNNLYYPSEKLLGILFRNVPAAKRRELRNDASNTSSDGGSIFNSLMEIDLSQLGLPPLQPAQDGLREEMVQLLIEYSEHLASIAQIFTISRLRGARISEAELISGTITGKWPDNRKRREAVFAMNLQTQELCTSIRRELRRVSLQDSDINDNFQKFEDEESEINDDELVLEKRAEVFSRAWAAWRVAEERRTEDPSAFGPQSFGLIALGLILDVIKDVTTAADACH